MLLLKFSHTVPTFGTSWHASLSTRLDLPMMLTVAAYVFYALSQAVTPAPQVEIVRNIIPDPQYFATGYVLPMLVMTSTYTDYLIQICYQECVFANNS